MLISNNSLSPLDVHFWSSFSKDLNLFSCSVDDKNCHLFFAFFVAFSRNHKVPSTSSLRYPNIAPVHIFCYLCHYQANACSNKELPRIKVQKETLTHPSVHGAISLKATNQDPRGSALIGPSWHANAAAMLLHLTSGGDLVTTNPAPNFIFCPFSADFKRACVLRACWRACRLWEK